MFGSVFDYKIIRDYCSNDEGVLEYNLITNLVFMISNSIFLLLMIFVADGWTITYLSIRDKLLKKFIFHILLVFI